MPLPRLLFPILFLALASSDVASAQLGTIDFPTSGPSAAQAHFVTGVLYLHSFEYESALKEFKEAQRLSPNFAMAYWGESMTYTHPVWDEQDSTAARAALARLGADPNARAAKAPTAREKEYLGAVEILYGAGSKEKRDTLYSAAMAALAQRYPKDVEAQLFYALSLLGLNQGDRDVPTYLKAGAIAETAFAHHPDHPGAAHYVIHSYDDPDHARIALAAARAYSKIAPSAAHAQHMTSHIFLALGLWDDVVSANETALNVVAAGSHAGMHGTCGHYAEWLLYGYLQQSRPKAAERVLAGCWEIVQRGSARAATSYAYMRASYLADSHDSSSKWADAIPSSANRDAAGALAFGTGLAAASRNDTATLARAIGTLDSLATPASGEYDRYFPVLRDELRAMLADLRKQPGYALMLARAAARADDSLPMPFGPPMTFTPPHELAGFYFAQLKQPDSAYAEFKLALARTPRRQAALWGFMVAAYASGHDAEGAAASADLKAIVRASQADSARH